MRAARVKKLRHNKDLEQERSEIALAVATAPDLRIVLSLVGVGAGWTVLPDYFCTDQLAARSLIELLTLRSGPENALYRAWNKGALRHPRVVRVREFLLSQRDRP